MPGTVPSFRRLPLRAGLALALLALAKAALAVETALDAGVDLLHDTNVTRAQQRDDIRGDAYLSGHLGAGLRWPVGDFDAVHLAAAVRGAQYARFPRLASVALGATLAYRSKLGVGLLAPWVSATTSLANENFREDTRDSNRVELRLEAGRRLSEQLDVSGGYGFDRRYARHDDVLVPGISGAVWDVAGHTGFVRAGRAVSDRWHLDAGYAYRRGDVVATTHRSTAIFLASDAIGPTSAFGPGFFDYRLRGTTQTGEGALSYAIDDRSALTFAGSYGFTRAAQGLTYQNFRVGGAWVYHY